MEPPAQLVTLGRIAGVFGIRGWVRVQSYTRPAENLLDYGQWWLAGNPPSPVQVLESRPHGGGFVAHLADAAGVEINDRDVAAALIGTEIQVDRDDLPPPEPGTWYWADLVGLRVQSLSGHALGKVVALVDNGAQDVLVLDDEGTQRLIPFVRGPIIHEVSPERGLIVADWEPDY